jgi:hypothetical protein
VTSFISNPGLLVSHLIVLSCCHFQFTIHLYHRCRDQLHLQPGTLGKLSNRSFALPFPIHDLLVPAIPICYSLIVVLATSFISNLGLLVSHLIVLLCCHFQFTIYLYCRCCDQLCLQPGTLGKLSNCSFALPFPIHDLLVPAIPICYSCCHFNSQFTCTVVVATSFVSNPGLLVSYLTILLCCRFQFTIYLYQPYQFATH